MRYDCERSVFLCSVRELVESALAGGNLDLRSGGGKPSLEILTLGSAAHRKIQAAAGTLYDAEYPLTNSTYYHGITFEVSGRADGIIHSEPKTVEEIKTFGGRNFPEVPDSAHLAQMKVYAYFYATEKKLSSVGTRLTYCRRSDMKIRSTDEIFSTEDLREFYLSLLSRIEFRARILIERATELLPSAASAPFPFSSVRDGQELLIKECYRDLKAGKKLFVQAPTGIGKTVSTLYPAVRILGEGKADKVFYLTAKASTRSEAFKAAGQLFRAGAHLRTVVLSSREYMCQNDAAKCDPLGISGHCNPEFCPYAKGYFDKVGTAICDLLAKQSGFPRQTIEETARAYGICPYEFSLDISELCDIIICDYNYVFDPMVYLRRYFEEEAVKQNRYLFLVDEAHNLGDRACASYSSELTSGLFASLLALLDPEDEFSSEVEKVGVSVAGFRRLCRDSLSTDSAGVEHGFYVNRQPMEEFHRQTEALYAAGENWLWRHRGSENEASVGALLLQLKRFLVISEFYDSRFLTFVEVHGDEVRLQEICLDPSGILADKLSLAKASVFFSATLTPTDYFSDILGGGKDSIRLSLPSPYDPSHLCLAAVTGFSTRFEDREKSVPKVVSCIAATVSAKVGNYIVYFPSYDYMEAVFQRFSEKYPKVRTVRQTRHMSGKERESFLDAFQPDKVLRIGFCVLGGSFSEGVDLPGDRLIGCIVVGTGLPGISSERNILRDYYDETRERGFDYAYTYPGMNRVLQAAGRVIRREKDRGVIVLIDDRWGTPERKLLFPEHWAGMQFAGNASELAEVVSDFWRSSQRKG